MKFINFKDKKLKYVVCYKIVQFCSILLFIPISVYPFLIKRLFWHPIKLEWYQKTTYTYETCFNEYLYPSETAIWSSIIIFFSLIGSLIMIINYLVFIYYLLGLTVIVQFLINVDVYTNAMHYKQYEHIYKQLNEVHKL